MHVDSRMRVPPVLPEREAPAPSPRHALLINPFYPKDPIASFGKHVLTPSLALTSVAAATPADWRVAYWDENLLQGPPPTDPMPAVVGITVHLTFAERAYALARWYRARGARVVLGGLHVLSCPDEAAQHADALAIGDGVSVWPRILRDAERDELAPRYVASFTSPFRDDPPPRHDLVSRRVFLTTTSLIATRGCHNRCEFCYLATDGLRMPYHMRDPEDVAEEWRREGTPYAVFLDNNLASRREYLRSLCRALGPLGRIWSAAVSIDVADDPTLVREMAASGCTAVFVGFESLTAENLTDARKKTPRPEDYARRVALLHEHGIAVNGSFVLGFDHDRPDVFARTADWVEAARLECATFHILTPYPGTPLFRRLDREGRILHRDWSRYDTSHVVFRPKHLSPTELERGYAWCYERLFSARSIWKRRPARTSELPSYLLMSALYKRSNWLWPHLVQRRLTGAVWGPLVAGARIRHLHFRRRFRKIPGADHADRGEKGRITGSIDSPRHRALAPARHVSRSP
jgi:radical SAM superfamily enzyme YgiQ (UPF0313 family)